MQSGDYALIARGRVSNYEYDGEDCVAGGSECGCGDDVGNGRGHVGGVVGFGGALQRVRWWEWRCLVVVVIS
jgi:hypothetical protein